MIGIIEKIQQFEVPAAVFLGAVTISLFFVIRKEAGKHGREVADRFLEGGTNYDPECLKKDPVYLKDWVHRNPDPARKYAAPVLFPLDLIFMLFLGGFLAVGSVACALDVDMLRSIAWFFAIFPALYVAADLIEDLLLARLLRKESLINEHSVRNAQRATSAKIKLASLSIGQTIMLSALAFFQIRG